MNSSLIRLDPIVYELRVYDDPVNDTVALEHMHSDFVCSALVTIDNSTARLSMMHGKMSIKAKTEIIRKLKLVGIERMKWERHKGGEVRYVDFRI